MHSNFPALIPYNLRICQNNHYIHILLSKISTYQTHSSKQRSSNCSIPVSTPAPNVFTYLYWYYLTSSNLTYENTFIIVPSESPFGINILYLFQTHLTIYFAYSRASIESAIRQVYTNSHSQISMSGY